MLRRKIPLNYRNVTGVAASAPGGAPTPFESTLERDFIEIIRFDGAVVSYKSQTPVIQYEDSGTGRRRTYTPDLFVEYADGRRIMYEVKPREVLWRDWHEFRPKFKHAIRYGKLRGYSFKIVTDVEIRTDYLSNIKFLSVYRLPDEYDARYKNLLNTLKLMESSSPAELIRVVGVGREAQAELLHVLWRLIADKLVGINMSKPITMSSPIWYRTGDLR